MSKHVCFIMGVSGTGKTTIGKLLSKELGVPFFDGDDYHSKENIEKMASGQPLNDDDRFGWLAKLNLLAKEHKTKGGIIACSALKEKYRIQLTTDIETDTRFIYLKGSFAEIKERLDSRDNHYMTSTLLKSQFDVLEPPKKAITVSIMETPKQIVKEILSQLK